MLDPKKRYEIRWDRNTLLTGYSVETRGNDEDYPCFIVDSGALKGKRISVHISKVIGVDDETL